MAEDRGTCSLYSFVEWFLRWCSSLGGYHSRYQLKNKKAAGYGKDILVGRLWTSLAGLKLMFINAAVYVAQETSRPDGIESEHLYLASANEIDEKKPELKNLPHHLEYVYLHGDESFAIIISSKLSKKEKMLLLHVLEKHRGATA
ncbi:hypothetical protein Tco_0511512 [Tanacetum coccineum]